MDTNSPPLFPVYGFLATLVLFLGASITASSVLLRRRNRRLMELNYTWIPTSRHPVAKPGMFEALLADEKGSCVNSGNGCVYGKKEDLDWDAIMPFSAAYLPPRDDCTALRTYPSTAATSHPKSFFPWPRRHICAPSTLPLTTGPPPLGPNGHLDLQPDTTPSTPSMLRVTVLITMPFSPRREAGGNQGESGGEKEGFPHVEFGIMDVYVGEGDHGH